MLRQALAEIIASEVKDPAVRQITLTDVEVTGDLREARIYFSHHGDVRDTEGPPALCRFSAATARSEDLHENHA